MPVEYAYLIGNIGLAIVFSLLCFVRKDLRRTMVFSGLLYLFYMTAVFLLSKVLSSDPTKMITPGYWSPPSILDLNRKTGGLGVEDAFYMFFVGAIASALYDVVFNFKISKRSNKKLKRGHALLIGLLTGSLAFTFTPINAVYFFIILQFVGALAIIWRRRDLIRHSLEGGIFFMLLYGVLFSIFKLLFPTFLADYYRLDRTSHLSFLGIPLEEFLYSLTLGMMWAPIYEYSFRVKDSKRRKSAPRTAGWAAARPRR